VSASQQQTLSGRGARAYIAHRGWLGVVRGISAASTGNVLVTYVLSLSVRFVCSRVGSTPSFRLSVKGAMLLTQLTTPLLAARHIARLWRPALAGVFVSTVVKLL